MKNDYIYIKLKLFIINIPIKIETILIIVVKITICPASSLSPPICCAILKDETAVGVPKITYIISNLIPVNPAITPNTTNIDGMTINFKKTIYIVCLKYFSTE